MLEEFVSQINEVFDLDMRMMRIHSGVMRFLELGRNWTGVRNYLFLIYCQLQWLRLPAVRILCTWCEVDKTVRTQ